MKPGIRGRMETWPDPISPWEDHIKYTRANKLCCFCLNPISEDRLYNGACQDCDLAVCMRHNIEDDPWGEDWEEPLTIP